MLTKNKRRTKFGFIINLLALGFSLIAAGYYTLLIFVEIARDHLSTSLYFYAGIAVILLCYVIIFVTYFVIRRYIKKPSSSLAAWFILGGEFSLGLWFSERLMPVIMPLHDSIWLDIYFCISFLIVAGMVLNEAIKYFNNKRELGEIQYHAGTENATSSLNNELSESHNQTAKPQYIRGARTIYIILMAIILIMVIGLSVIGFTGYIPSISGGKLPFWVTEVLPIVLALFCLLNGYFRPVLTRKYKAQSQPDAVVFRNCLVRAMYFADVALISLVFGLMGSSLYICLTMIAVTGIVSIVTFPTEKRWANWLNYQQKNRSTDGNR